MATLKSYWPLIDTYICLGQPINLYTVEVMPSACWVFHGSTTLLRAQLVALVASRFSHADLVNRYGGAHFTISVTPPTTERLSGTGDISSDGG